MKNKIIIGLLLIIKIITFIFLTNTIKIKNKEIKNLSSRLETIQIQNELINKDLLIREQQIKKQNEKTYLLQEEIKKTDSDCLNCIVPAEFTKLMRENSL
jgi:hypothetical protein